jgi:hypothetical protein
MNREHDSCQGDAPNENQVLVASKFLVGRSGIELVLPKGDLEYWHILFDNHEAIFAEGVPAETLFLGLETIKSLDAEHLIEICDLLGLKNLSEISESGHLPCRPFLSGKESKKLIRATEEKLLVSAG